MIQTRALTKRFGPLTAVDGLDLDIAQGELFACLGPNGAGKTTSIKMMAGLLRPSSGAVSVAGFDMATQADQARAALAYVPDFPFLYDKLTACEFMRFVGDLFSIPRHEQERRVGELFPLFHLDEYAHELTENLSHGTRQRLAIASALLHRPRVLIIDEPMVGLDPTHARVVKKVFKDLARGGTTVFLSTHQLAVAEELADRVGIIHRGRLLALGTVAELRARSQETGALERVFLSLVDGEDNAAR